MKPLIYIFSSLYLLSFLLSCQEDKEDEPLPYNTLKAVAGPDREVTIDTQLTLDGTASQDGKNKPQVYQWTLISQPEGSIAEIEHENKVQAHFTPDLEGTYTIELKVFNVIGSSAADKMIITATADTTEAPQMVFLSQDIEAARVLPDIFEDPNQIDYLVTEEIAINAGLTVEAGVLIAFEADAGLQVQSSGFLKTLGTADDSVKLTGKEKVEGYWKGILFGSPSQENMLNYTEVSYAGSEAFSAMEQAANIGIDGEQHGFVHLRHISVLHGKHYGLYAEKGSDFQMERMVFSANDIPLSIPLELSRQLDASSEMDQSNHSPWIEINEGTVFAAEEAIVSKFAGALQYHIPLNLEVYGGLSIREGVNLVFAQDKGIFVREQGYLSAQGSAHDPVIFSSIDQMHGHWAGILIQSSHALNQLDHIDLSRAGSTLLPGMDVSTGIGLEGDTQARLKLSNSFVGYNVNKAVYVEPKAWLESTNNQLLENQEQDIITLLQGSWLDSWSFQNGYVTDEQFYDTETGVWFRGANSPWDMNPRPGTGFSIQKEGTFVWNYALSTGVGGCQSYTVEYLRGSILAEGNTLLFEPAVRRKKYHSSCEPTLNFDKDEATDAFRLTYELRTEINELGLSYRVLSLHHDNGALSEYYQYIKPM